MKRIGKVKKSRLEFKETDRKYERIRVTKDRVKMCVNEVAEVEEKYWAEAQLEEINTFFQDDA